jgi:FixJ family two-component response regulator
MSEDRGPSRKVRRPGGDEIIGDRLNGRPIVYVVDPDPAMREELRALFGRGGCAVRTYSSAEGFLSDFSEDGAGCLVTQHWLPGLSGLDLVRRLNETDLPTVFLTGRGDVRAAVDAMRAGAAACLETPYVPRVLLNQVRRLLG